jgi:MSHA biogenesis protein MshK
MAHHMTRLSAFCILLLLAASAQAQTTLRDPTRPPASMGESVPDADVVSGPVLQTVIIPAQGKPMAVISGKTVPLGGKFGDSRLVRLTEREAVLVGPTGTEHLLLTPGADKTRGVTKNEAKTPVAHAVPRGSKP